MELATRSTPIEQAAAGIAAFSADFDSVIRGITETIANIAKAFERSLPAIEQAMAYYNVGQVLSRAGWLPHDVIPFELVRDVTDPHEMDQVVTQYLAENWLSVETRLRDRYASVGLDDEGLATMAEALAAHRAGLYRCVCRTVFPEIDRMARLRYYRPKNLQYGASLNELRDAFGESLSLPDFGSNALWYLYVFDAISDTCYRRFTDDIMISTDEIQHPNRHALAHGFASFSTIKNSINTLFIADFMFHGIDALAKAA